MNLISIDPGKHQSGVCYWTGAVLVGADLVPATESISSDADQVVCELMQVYPGGRHAADLVDVTFSAGVLCAEYFRAGKVTLVHPRQWKGTIPKDIHHKRLYANMTQNERDVISRVACAKSVLHNVVDAYGIGKWFLERKGK